MRTGIVLACGTLCCVVLACSEEVGLGGEGDDAGAGGEAGAMTAGTAGSTPNAGTGGSGNVEPNTCPPSLLNQGSGPGILCDETGATCADSEQFCHCGELTIEGRPWSCVPTEANCPVEPPSDGDPCEEDTPERCQYVGTDGRTECACVSGSFDCQPSDCAVGTINHGARCDMPGAECAYFRPDYPGQEGFAGNVPCVCSDDGFWSCDDGCPKEFSGEGATCDPNLGLNCTFRTDAGLLFCGCGSEPAQWNCVSGGDG
jgi:hypothetical protein